MCSSPLEVPIFLGFGWYGMGTKTVEAPDARMLGRVGKGLGSLGEVLDRKI